MRAKQILTLALIGALASCTVSKRIDKWGYRVSFDKKVKSELASEGQERKADAVQTEEIKLGCAETKTRAAQETATVIRDVTSIPQENQAVGFSNKASEKQRETEVKTAPTLNRKAEKIMKKMVTNQAHGESSRRVEDVVLVILCLFIPIGNVPLRRGNNTTVLDQSYPNLVVWPSGYYSCVCCNLCREIRSFFYSKILLDKSFKTVMFEWTSLVIFSLWNFTCPQVPFAFGVSTFIRSKKLTLSCIPVFFTKWLILSMEHPVAFTSASLATITKAASWSTKP